MQTHSPEPAPRRAVRPRQKVQIDKPIIAIDDESVLLENGEVLSVTDLPAVILSEPSSIVVAHQVGHIVRELDKVFDDHPRWQFRATPVERELWGPNRKYRTTIRDTTIAFFGFQGKNKRAGHYHFPVSPEQFVLQTANKIRRDINENPETLYKLMEWGKDLRSFLQEQELPIKPTTGGIAGQLLRDERFYPFPRRKVPFLTNAAARDKLPGNFYKLYDAGLNKSYRAAYLDQRSSHHTIASELEFPDADTLRRKGRYKTLGNKSYIRYDHPKFKSQLSEHGLFLLNIRIPHYPRKRPFMPPAVDRRGAGLTQAYLYSNELEYVQSIGCQIDGIIAQWTSPNIEHGLNCYAKWALEELAKADGARKPWLKPTLLATYGVLAARPKKIEFGYKRAENGEEKQYPCGSGFLTVQAKRMEQLREMPTANVIHRGMIEAETRLRSMRLATELRERGYSILAIYADSIFVADADELPFLPSGWRIQAFLTALRFQSATAFTSRELTKMPGVSVAERQRARLPHRRRLTSA